MSDKAVPVGAQRDGGGPVEGAVFDDGKAPDALRTIGEVGRALGLKPHVLRYWEEQFDQLQPVKRSGNRRYYRPEDVALVIEIDRLLNSEGYTLRGAAKALKGAVNPVACVPQTIAPEETPATSGADDLAALKRIRDNLVKALAEA